MHAISRRGFLAALTAGSIAAASQGRTTPVPMLHVTDLFRPHGDPDDHWDLACVYALAHQGRVELKAVMTDYPPAARRSDPDVLGVAQMNYLTGQTAPVMVGSPRPMQSRNDAQPDATPLEDGGIRALLRLLRESPRPLVINVLGSCCDVAIAGRREPKLFAKKCAAIYLNAGTGTPDKAKAARLEYNVNLNPAGYAAMFDLPCPIYWMPCFEEMPAKGQGSRDVMEFGTFYRFLQGDILPALSPRMKNFFAWMYKHGRTGKIAEPPGCDWLRYLLGPNDDALLARQGALYRNMWCTGGFLHAAGLTAARDGRIIPLAGSGDEAVFTFEPIRVRCSDSGVTEWTKAASAKDRFIFRVLDPEKYAAAMTAAMKSLLATLP
ncbi:MAG: hypothetical protein HZA91_17150 [Verrucomicrobia bacterium]|nr:hypothetical protein [Verrucomicrobiota bacterium]